jgi:hypothetical protein
MGRREGGKAEGKGQWTSRRSCSPKTSEAGPGHGSSKQAQGLARAKWEPCGQRAGLDMAPLSLTQDSSPNRRLHYPYRSQPAPESPGPGPVGLAHQFAKLASARGRLVLLRLPVCRSPGPDVFQDGGEPARGRRGREPHARRRRPRVLNAAACLLTCTYPLAPVHDSLSRPGDLLLSRVPILILTHTHHAGPRRALTPRAMLCNTSALKTSCDGQRHGITESTT